MNSERTETNNKRSAFILVLTTAVITLLLAGGAAYFSGHLGPRQTTTTTAVSTADHDHGRSAKTLYTCGMHPWIISDQPGNCPICGMKLVPKRNEAMGGVEVKIDPVTQQNMGIRTAQVRKGSLTHTIRTYGHITYDETRLTEISPKFNGWIEKLYVDFTGQMVNKDQPLFDIYSPELTTAQEEYLVAFRNPGRLAGGSREAMLASVRRRLSYFDVPDQVIRDLEKTGVLKKALTIRSPFKGIVTHKNAVEGGYIKSGTTVYRIADVSTVWVEAHIFEYELDRVKTGQTAEMTLPYMPGRVYKGKVAFVYPYLQQKTRDVVIRIEYDNPNLELKPDMYADIRIQIIADHQGLLVPDEAVIRSGERNLVFVTRGDGKFTPREVNLGIRLDGGNIQVLSGLAEGETVVSSGQFLIDSESKLKEAIQKMTEGKNVVSKPEKSDTGTEADFFGDMEMKGHGK